MNDRSALGPADVSDAELARMVAAQYDADPTTVELVDVRVTPVDYDLPALTTASRNRVQGTARIDGAPAGFSIFVKHIQSWGRSPFFADVPPEVREFAEASVPWRTEALAYRSDLREHLPDGLTMPRALGVFDLDEKSAAVWLEDVPAVEVAWDRRRFERAAGLLGRIAGSPAVAAYARVGEFDWSVRDYLFGRLLNQVIPMLQADPLWQHPLVAGAYDDELRTRLLRAADLAAEYVEELMSFPVTAGHGDACPSNLLVRAADDDSFTLIDFGFWQELPVGFDLAQLLVGDVQIGRRSAADLAERGEACLVAYSDGLRAEGFEIDGPDLRRAHALQLLIFTGLSTIPFEHLEAPPSPELTALAADRAAISRYSLDLLGATG